MDNQIQQHFFLLLRKTYETATTNEHISVVQILTQIKNELSIILNELK